MTNFNSLLKGCANNLSNQLPLYRGRMRASVKYFNTSGVSNKVLGKIIIDVPYANYVNYGFEDHPKSKKLKSDYQIVERIITRTIRAYCKGVNVR